jgi:gluconokinase
MPPALLASQLATLEPPTPDEGAVTIDIDQPLAAQIAAALLGLGLDPTPKTKA